LAEANEVLSQQDENCYAMIRTLLEACRATGNSDGAAKVQAAIERLGLAAVVPVASAFLQGSERRCENGIIGDGVADARTFWLKLRRESAYTPRFEALS